jgi:hypothetical protein
LYCVTIVGQMTGGPRFVRVKLLNTILLNLNAQIDPSNSEYPVLTSSTTPILHAMADPKLMSGG